LSSFFSAGTQLKQTRSSTTIFLLLWLGVTCAGNTYARWDFFVNPPPPPIAEYPESQYDTWMSNCLTFPGGRPENLCIREGHVIVYWVGNEPPCPDGGELEPGSTNCSPPPADPQPGGPKPCGDGQTPNPVDISSGNKYQSRIDYTGSGQFPITFGVYFNSLNTVDTNYFNAHWTHDYSRSLSISIDNITGPWGVLSDQWILAKRDDGSAYRFIKDGSDIFRDRDGSSPMYLEELAGANQEHWKLTNPGKFIEFYDQNGLFLRVVDIATNLEQKLSYNGNQVTIQHTNGDSLTLQYPSGAITTAHDNFVSTRFPAPVSAILTLAGQFDYSFNTTNTRLETVTFTSNETGATPIQLREYLYEDSNFPLFYTKEKDARDRIVSSVTYHPDGKVASSQKGLTGEQHHFDYPSNSETTVTNSFGLQTYYVFQSIPPRKLLTVKGAATSTCNATSNLMVYDTKNRKIGAINTYDGNFGVITQYHDDNRIKTVVEGGRLAGVTPVYANRDARLKEYIYDNTNDLIQEIIYRHRDGPSSTANWIDLTKVEYSYWPNKRIHTVTSTDLSNFVTPLGSTNGQTRTITYSYTYHSGNEIPADTLVHTMTVDGPLPGPSDRSIHTYDIQSRLTLQENALGHRIEYRDFNALGLPQTIENSNGVVTSIGYHALGWIESVNINDPSGITSLNSEIRYAWYPNGTLEQVTYPDGSFLHYEYSDARHTLKIVNNLGESLNYTRNALGDWTFLETQSTSNNIVRLQNRIYDDLGRLREELGNNGQQTIYTYDIKDNIIQVQERGAFTANTINHYDTLNRITRVLQPRRTEVNGQLTSINHNTYYTYNSQDRITSVIDPKGNSTTYDYNGFGEKITQTSPDTGTTQYWYSEQGNVTSKQDARGITVQYHYDELGRLTWIQYPDSSEDVHYYYDEVSTSNPYALGKLTRITDQSGNIAYSYDHRGNITQDTRVVEGQSYTTSYDYNLADNLSSITYPSGRIVNYLRNDPLGRISAVTTQQTSSAPEQNLINNIRYLPFGPVQQYTYGNGLIRQVPYDLDYRVDQIQVTGINTVMDIDYGYDRFNNINSILNNLNGGLSQSFLYDDLHRLQHAHGNYGTNTDHIRYEYDPVSNRTLKALGQADTIHTTETYTYNPLSNQLDSVTVDTGVSQNVRTLFYNDAGALSAESTLAGQNRTYNYNDNLRLIELTESSIRGSYRHNALGQRVRKTNPEGTTHYHFGLNGQLLGEGSPGKVERHYLYLNGEMIAIVDAAQQ